MLLHFLIAMLNVVMLSAIMLTVVAPITAYSESPYDYVVLGDPFAFWVLRPNVILIVKLS
jgi:hypothetical protein